MTLNQKNLLKSLVKHLKKFLISILLVILIWSIYIGITFELNPRVFCKTIVNEDIAWEIEKYEPTESDPGEISIYFIINYEVWINTPLPFIHSFDGCHLKPKAEAIFTNISTSEEILYFSSGCYLATVPVFYKPGITHKAGTIFFRFNYTDISGLPEGLYTFWADFGDLYGRDGIIKAYKTYMNVSEEGLSIYSDDIIDYKVWFWGRYITSTCIVQGSILVVYIGFVFKNNIIEYFRKKRK